MPNVKVTVGGLRPPRLWHENPLPSQVATFCRAYNQYVERINIANEDGEQRTPASLRELVPNAVQEFVCFKWYKTKQRNELTEEDLRKGLYKMGGIEEIVIEARKFKQDMGKVLKMDPSLPVRARVQKIQQALITYVTNNHLMDAVRPRGVWSLGYGKIVVDAMVAGVAPDDFRRDVKERVEFDQLGNDPNGVMEVLDDMVERRIILEEGMRRATYKLAQTTPAGGAGQTTGGKSVHARGPGLKGGSGTGATAKAPGQPPNKPSQTQPQVQCSAPQATSNVFPWECF